MVLFGTSSEPDASLLDLPHPGKDAAQHSQSVSSSIQQEITKQQGTIDFCTYMNLALYEPGLGYYSAGPIKLGQSGDFITAPDLSPVFSLCLTQQLYQILNEIDHGTILEIGPGSGAMASEILQELERLDCLPEEYLLLERSADLRERQKEKINAEIPHLSGIIRWLDQLPEEKFNGIIIANEVIDALPVHRFVLENHEIKELRVGYKNGNFTWNKTTPGNDLLGEIEIELSNVKEVLPEGYTSEINIRLASWINTFSELLLKGVILLIDYGYTRQEYYHPQRTEGTLLCHYRHRVHSDPFFYPGLQDITSSVNFSKIAEAAVDAELDVCGFTTQAHFLIACGLEAIVARLSSENEIDQAKLSSQVRTLVMPVEMGERFKVIGLKKNFDTSLIGFQFIDHRARL